MLSARNIEVEKVRCLDYGADDYLTKPFGIDELMARIKAILRRRQANEMETDRSVYELNNLKIDFNRQMVFLDGASVNLTAREYHILSYMAANAGRIITNEQMLDKIWGESYSGEYHILRVNMARLRKKLNDTDKNHKYIQTRPGIGYMMLATA